MSNTQLIKCRSCGKELGTVDINTGDIYSVHSIKKPPVVVPDNKQPNEVKKAVKKAEHFKIKKVQANIDDKSSVTCTCGVVNNLY